jgi:hypothetical protein
MNRIKKYLIVLILSACGFMPMYSDKQINVLVAPITGTNGIDLRNALNAKFGNVGNETSKYKLEVKLNEPITRYKALQTTGDATWQEVELRASYTLTFNEKIIAKGTEVASESYTFVRYLVAANASYNNAVQNTIKVLSEKIGSRVIAEVSILE